MIKDVVIHNGLLRIATGTFVCMVGHSENGRGGALARARQNSCPLNISNAVKVADELLVTRVLRCFPSEDFPIKDTSSRPELKSGSFAGGMSIMGV
jgi:hypothetical protein